MWCAGSASALVSRPGADLCRRLIMQQSATSLKRCWVKSAACLCTKGLAALRVETAFVDKCRINTWFGAIPSADLGWAEMDGEQP